MQSSWHDKYKKCKNVYKNICKQYMINNIGDFYITHMIVGGEASLYEILKDGYLRPGKDVKHQHLLAANSLEHIYGNINFCDLNNIGTLGSFSLQFHPQVIFDYGMIFNRGWFKYPYESSVYIYDTDTFEDKIIKLKKIKEYLMNPTFYPKHLSKSLDGKMLHEIMINRPIQLDKYLIGINCVCSDTDKNKIKHIVNLNYPGVKILHIDNIVSILPTLKELLL